MRERPDGVRETLRVPLRGQVPEQPERRDCVRSDGTIYFSDPWYGRMPVFGIERERELGWQGVFRIPPGGGQDELAARRRAATSTRCRTGSASRPDESLLYVNDTPGAYIKVYDVERRRHARERPHVLRRHRHRRHRGGHPGRDEVRRAREHLGHRPEGRLGDLPRGRASRHGPRAGEHRQPLLGRAGLAHAVHPVDRPRSTRSRTTVGPRREPYMG